MSRGRRRFPRTARWALVLAGCVLAGCGADAPETVSDDGGIAAVMSAPADAGFRRATTPGSLRFPRDHGPHPDFQSEWWYFTGNLADAAGRAFGFQLTLFRFALAAGETRRVSRFATRQVWMGHFAVTDVESGRFHHFERFARGAAGLAGAEARPLRVWVEDWRVDAVPGTGAGPFPLRLQAARGAVALDLVLDEGRPRVLQGDAGLSRKNDGPGNASYYYSYTRLPARGVVRIEGREFRVTGNAWMDREWSTSALASDQTGWDWFALQLDDGQDVMFYRLRDAGGGMHPFSAGVVVGPQGVRRRLGADEVRLEAISHWRSPQGRRYPVRWALRTADLDLTVSASVDEQEHRGSFRYWEGAVRVAGRGRTGPISGAGYLEMTGY